MTQAGDNRVVASEAPIPERASVEVRPTARRRQFSVGYRRRIVEEAASMTPTERGALLRREGLDSSHLVRWKAEMKMKLNRGKADTDGEENNPRRRGPKPDPKLAEIRQLERENARLTAKLKQAELIIDAQKKLAEIFGAGAGVGATQPAEMAMGRSIGGR